MSYPSGSGVVTNNCGPSTPNGATQGQAPPFGSPGAPANVAQTTPAPATYNFTNGIESTQEAISTTVWNVPQQGVPYNTNSSSVILAGLRVSDFTYFKG